MPSVSEWEFQSSHCCLSLYWRPCLESLEKDYPWSCCTQIAETEELLMEKLRKWKRGMELKGLRVNIGDYEVSGENRSG